MDAPALLATCSLKHLYALKWLLPVFAACLQACVISGFFKLLDCVQLCFEFDVREHVHTLTTLLLSIWRIAHRSYMFLDVQRPESIINVSTKPFVVNLSICSQQNNKRWFEDLLFTTCAKHHQHLEREGMYSVAINLIEYGEKNSGPLDALWLETKLAAKKTASCLDYLIGEQVIRTYGLIAWFDKLLNQWINQLWSN